MSPSTFTRIRADAPAAPHLVHGTMGLRRGTPSFTSRCARFALEMLVALCLALLIWLYTRTRDQDTIDHVPIPVEITLAAASVGEYDLEVPSPSRVSVSFTGPLSRLREVRSLLQRDALRVAIQLSVPREHHHESSYRETVRVQPADIQVPPGVIVAVVEGQNRIPVVLHRLVERRLLVRLDSFGEESAGQVKIEPATVLVRGPQDILERAHVLPTLPVVLPETNTQPFYKGRVELPQELEGRPIRTSPPSVAYLGRVQPRQKVYELTDLPIHFLCPPDFKYSPRFASPEAGTIAVSVRGPAGDAPPAVNAYIDLSQLRPGGGRKIGPVQLQLPRDVQLAQESPPEVEYYLDPVVSVANNQDVEAPPD